MTARRLAAASTVTLLLLTSLAAAIPLPSAEDIEQYKADGRWPQVQQYIAALHQRVQTRISEGELLQLVEDGYGLPTSSSGAGVPARENPAGTEARPTSSLVASPRANLNGDSVVDERDILELGYLSASDDPNKAGNSAGRSSSVALPYGTAAEGNQPRALVLLIKFPDQEPTDKKNQGASDVNHDAAWAEQKWFDLDEPANLEDASVAYYFKSVSHGKLELTGDVFDNSNVCDADGWITSSEEYGDLLTGVSNYTTVVNDALSQIDPYIDFADYDSNADGHVDSFITIYAGADNITNPNSNLWYFRWLDEPGSFTNDGVRVGQGVWVSEQGYLYHFCHEYGHELGLPDLYDVGLNLSGPAMPGAGMWTLMSDWDTNTGKIPALPDAWCRTRLRWIDPVEVLTTDDTDLTLNCCSTASTPDDTVFRIWRNGARGPEYFLMEYRDATAGFDQNLFGDGGVLVWHADEGATTGNNRDNDFFPARIIPEPADWDFAPNTADDDPWRSGFDGGDGVDYFDDNTEPSAKDNDGSATGVKIDPLDSPGGATMTVTVHNAAGTLPTLSITAPANGASVSGAVTFDVTSDATQRVEYYVNGCLKHSESGPSPYDGFSWDTLTAFNGTAVLRAVAVSSGTQQVRVAELTVTVDNPQVSGADVGFSDSFNSYGNGQSNTLLGAWNLHGDAFGADFRILTIDGGTSPALAFTQSSFPAPPFDGNEQDPNAGVYEGQDDDWLLSPRLDLSGHSNLELKYKCAFRGSWSGDSVLQTQLTADDGATWHDLDGLTSHGAGGPLDDMYETGLWDPTGDPFTYFSTRTVDLDQYVNAQVYIRFLYVGGGSYNIGFALDDFSVSGTPLLLSSVTPARRQVGQSITLAGNGFGSPQGSGRVRFADGSGGFVEQATVSSWSNTQIVCNVPAGAKSDPTAGIWVRTDAGIDTNAKPFKVVLAPPVLGGVVQK
jgi:immune inhibitor A